MHAERETDLAAMAQIVLEHMPDNPAALVCKGVALVDPGQRFG